MIQAIQNTYTALGHISNTITFVNLSKSCGTVWQKLLCQLSFDNGPQIIIFTYMNFYRYLQLQHTQK